MEITVHLPDALARRLRQQSGDLTRRTLEALAVDAYRTGAFTFAEVQALLGLDSRWATEVFLREAGAPVAYDEADLVADRQTLRDALGT
jgi:predicted HTH domain antitoxin